MFKIVSALSTLFTKHMQPANCFLFFQEDFLPLYDLQYSFLWVTFSGKTEEELSGHLESVREGAKRMGMHWAHRRSCFLLGRLCAKKLKFSQVCASFLAVICVVWMSTCFIPN